MTTVDDAPALRDWQKPLDDAAKALLAAQFAALAARYHPLRVTRWDRPTGLYPLNQRRAPWEL